MEEWKTYKISEITTMTNGKKRQQSNGNIPVYGGNGIMDYCSESNCENTVIIGLTCKVPCLSYPKIL